MPATQGGPLERRHDGRCRCNAPAQRPRARASPHAAARAARSLAPPPALTRHAYGAVGQVVGAALHLLGVRVEVVAAHGDADEQVAVLHVVDVHVPAVLPACDAQRAQHGRVVAALVGHLGHGEAVDDVQVAPRAHLVPAQLAWGAGAACLGLSGCFLSRRPAAGRPAALGCRQQAGAQLAAASLPRLGGCSAGEAGGARLHGLSRARDGPGRDPC